MNDKIRFSILIPVIALVIHFGQQFLPRPGSYFELITTRIILPILIAFAATWFLHRRWSALPSAWGLNSGILTGLMTAFLFCIPMLLGYGLLAGFKIGISWQSFWIGCVGAAISEELVYRGFLFGQLFRYGGWGFLTAGLFNAVLFGSGHLHQSGDLSGAMGVFLITALGGLWFAWLYIEWDHNIWLPIFMHFFMNVSWDFFDVGENAAGGLMANIFRAVTIAVSIIYTILMKRKSTGLIIKQENLFVNRNYCN